MSDPFVAEIRIFAGNFAPTGWATCDGQIMPISQNTALFSLLGTTYGGDGKSTFALPNLMGSAPMHPGQGPGLSEYDLGQTSGTEAVTLLTSEVAAHNHAVMANINPGQLNTPSPVRSLARSSGGFAWKAGGGNGNMALTTLSLAGGGLPHNNMQPYLTLLFIIALQGVFPPRG